MRVICDPGTSSTPVVTDEAVVNQAILHLCLTIVWCLPDEAMNETVRVLWEIYRGSVKP